MRDALDAHAGEADDVGARDAVEVDRRDVLVEIRDAMRGGVSAASRGRLATGIARPLAEQRQRVLEAPVRRLEARD